MYTYVHPLYMYIHHTYTIYTPNTPLNTLYTHLYTPLHGRYALDGFPIYGAFRGKSKAEVDALLDECNGRTPSGLACTNGAPCATYVYRRRKKREMCMVFTCCRALVVASG